MKLERLRREYHEKICRDILGRRGADQEGALSNADSSSLMSRRLAEGMAREMGLELCTKVPSSQAAGSLFAQHTKDFLESAFGLLEHLRPGPWRFSTSQGAAGIARYEQYRHLAELAEIFETHPNVRTALGGDYYITPDIVVARIPVDDDTVNRNTPDEPVVDDTASLAQFTPLRMANNPSESLHASISCKWTMRSDRAQNTRTEALNLIRNRKGKTPHISVVTAEPLPSRLASIALGTGDVDCTYHAALPELMAAAASIAEEEGHPYLLEELQVMVEGRRLRDISDLPFDLAI